MRRVSAHLAVIFLVAIGAPDRLYCQGGDAEGINPLGAQRGGLHLYGVSASASYYSLGQPDSFSSLPSGLNLSSDVAIGASANLGWNRTGQQSNMSVLYSPSFSGRVNYSQWNAFNQALAVNASRKLSQKWTAAISAQASISTSDSFLFSPTTLSSVTDIPVTFEDLAAAMLTGKFSNNQLASILTGAPAIETPARTLLYGYRSLASGLQGSISYAHSSRLTIILSGVAGRNQHLPSKADATYANLIDKMTAATATASLSYSLSPRTEFGVSVNSSHTFSGLQAASTYSGNVSFGRRMGRRWMAQFHGGAGSFNSATSLYASPKGAQYIGGGSLAYKTFSHTLIGTFERSITDSYLFGGGNSSTAQGAWKWRRPGGRLTFSSNVSWQKIDGFIVPPITSWRVSGGVSRSINTHTSIQAQYSYMSSSGLPLAYTTASNLAQSGIQLAISWMPQNTSGPR